MRSEVYNINCMEYMKTLPDKYFDLVIADPPYGIKEDGLKNHSRSKLAKAQEYTPKDWDKQSMPKEFFNELIRVSKNQIIWGANHFISQIPYDSPCWIVWDKDTATTTLPIASLLGHRLRLLFVGLSIVGLVCYKRI